MGKNGRTDKCKTILEKLTLYEVARRLEKAFDLLQRPGLNLDIVNVLYLLHDLPPGNEGGYTDDTVRILLLLLKR